ncbi:hypothetical protein HI855_03045 [Cyanobacteria bacterium 150NLHA]|uniref:hypothetical protein n=1 Tax=Prochlorococcus sp. P1361 TaxID=2729589 RepID=UPI00145DFA73|nr:hypothetical protein [Prochlorococcus sp. P1361]NMP05564.1 hypothetical protein [Prochlorococcus sp. P1361]
MRFVSIRNSTEIFFQMTLIQIYDKEVTSEFKSFLDQIKPNVEAYAVAKGKAQFERMMIIGKIKEYQKQFPQRSAEHRTLANAMKSEGWSKDVISDNVSAYNFYHQEYDEGDWFNSRPQYLDQASVTHLAILGRDKTALLRSKVDEYFTKHGEIPSASALRGYQAGFITDEFKPLSSLRTKPQIEEQTSQASAVDVEVVTEPSNTAEESLPPTQEQLVDQLITIVQAMNLDEIYGDQELKAKLEVVRDPLMTLAHIAIPSPPRPTYV